MSTSNPFEVTSPELPFASEHQRVRLKRVGVLSMAVFSGAILGALGVLGAMFMFLAFAFRSGVTGPGIGALEGGVQVLIFPVVYGVMGFVGGAIGAIIYNIIAGMTGGIEMEFAPDA